MDCHNEIEMVHFRAANEHSLQQKWKLRSNHLHGHEILGFASMAANHVTV